jgi:hypothetical protein
MRCLAHSSSGLAAGAARRWASANGPTNCHLLRSASSPAAVQMNPRKAAPLLPSLTRAFAQRPVQTCIRGIMWTSAVEGRLLIAGAMTPSCGTLFTWGGDFSGKGTSHRGALGTGDEAGRLLPTRQDFTVVCASQTVTASPCWGVNQGIGHPCCWLLTDEVTWTLQGGGAVVRVAGAAGGCWHDIHSGAHSDRACVSDGRDWREGREGALGRHPHA